MYEELYEKLDGAEKTAYLARIGVEGDVRADRESLDRLVFAHQCAVPFENLDICELGRDIPLATKSLFEKIVTKRRGGYCFELNALFFRLLEACGFSVSAHIARVMREKGAASPPLHRVTLALIDGAPYFCDVGFGGPMPGAALLFAPGVEQRARGDRFWFEKENDFWMTLWRGTASGPAPVVSVCTVPQEPVDFIAPNEYCFRSPLSFFRIGRMANIRKENGALQLMNDVLTEFSGEGRSERKLETRRELDEALASGFGIELPAAKDMPPPPASRRPDTPGTRTL